jgi:hypothetical protein
MSRLKVAVFGLMLPPHAFMPAKTCMAVGQSPCKIGTG